MEHILSQIDVYGVLAAILSVILTAVVPFLSFKYRKLLLTLKECKKLLTSIIVAWEDRKITEEEMKKIISDVSTIINTIKG